VHPAAGICTAAVLCLAGTFWFASQRETEPPAATLHAPAEPLRSGRVSARRARLASPALAILMPVYLFLGAMFVTVDLSTVAFAAHFGHKDLAGFILGTYALGSATGGLWYGARTWNASAARRLAVTLTLTVAGVCTFWAMPNLAALTAVIFLCGLTIAPTLIAGYSLLESTAQPGRITEAMSWLSTGIYVGVAAGSTAAGFVLDALGPRDGYAFAACCGCLAAVLYLGGLFLTRRLRDA